MSDLSLDELLKVLEEAQKSSSSTSSKRGVGQTKEYATAKYFIRDFGVESGLDRVPNYVIYYTYRIVWDKQKASNKTNKINFFRTFNKQFKQVRTGRQRYYLLNGAKFDLTREGLLKAKHYDEQETKRVKTKRKKVSSKKQEPKK